MDLEKHAPFLRSVKEYLAEYPEVAPYATDFIAQGISAALSSARDRAADMEIALLGSITSRMKNGDTLVLDKLRKWNGKTSLRWDDAIARLEKSKQSKDEE